MEKVKVALIPNDFYTPRFQFEQVIEFCRQEEVKYIEIAYLWGKSILDLDEGEVQRLHEILDENGISIASIQTQIMKVFPRNAKLSAAGSRNMHRDHDYNLSRIDSAIEMAREFNTPYIITYSYFTHLVNVNDELWNVFLENYAPLVEKCKAAGKIMVVECEGDTLVNDTVTYKRLFERFQSPHLQANLDLANFVSHVGQFTREDFDSLKDHVKYLHVKDRILKNKSLLGKLPIIGPLFRSRGAVFGTGDIPWRQVLPWLHESGFDGVLSVEPHVHGKNKPVLCKQCVLNLKAMLYELNIPYE